MAVRQEDFLYGDDIDAVLSVIDADIFENDADFDSEVKALIDHIPTEQVQSGNKCDFCDKVCVTKRGLTRHIKVTFAPYRFLATTRKNDINRNFTLH